MGKDSGIQWTTHTFNCWRGCTRVSQGCRFCYAETMSKRNPKTLGVWGPNGTRVVASESKWREPIAWDRAAQAAGERHRVFCASLADVFEAWAGPMLNSQGQVLWDHVFDWKPGQDGAARGPVSMDDVRIRLWKTILATPHLDWLILTKRPENVLPTLRRMKATRKDRGLDDGVLGAWIDGTHPPDNVWMGTSTEIQEEADRRIPELLKIPAAVRFLSVEPMLSAINLAPWLEKICPSCKLTSNHPHCPMCHRDREPGIAWTIVGGESGHHARPFDVNWARSLRDQCNASGTPYFLKQLSANPYDSADPGRVIKFKDSHGGDWDEWPDDLKVRQFPKAVA